MNCPRPIILFIASGILTASCSEKKDEPYMDVFCQPESIVCVGEEDQYFTYDEYGKVVKWEMNSRGNLIVAEYKYESDTQVRVAAEFYYTNGSRRVYNEKISLSGGRATTLEGTFEEYLSDGFRLIAKTYGLHYSYDYRNQVIGVKHSEVVGIGDDIPDTAWNKPWTWDNNLIWSEEGNLITIEDYSGKSYVAYTNTYSYAPALEAGCALVYPDIDGLLFHCPLQMQGLFGANPQNLITAVIKVDYKGNTTSSNSYSYNIEDGKITSYDCKTSFMTGTVGYKVEWTVR